MKKKQIKIISILLLFALTFSLVGCGLSPANVNSKDPEEQVSDGTTLLLIDKVEGETYTDLGGHRRINFPRMGMIEATDTYNLKPADTGTTIFRDIAYAVYESVLGSAPGIGQDFTGATGSLAGKSLDPGSMFDKGMQIANSISASGIGGGLKAAATSIFLAMWLMTFMAQIINERFTMESMLKGFMQLLCGIVIIVNAETIVGAFAALSNGASASSAPLQAPKIVEFCSKLFAKVAVIILGFDTVIPWGFGVIWIDILPIVAAFLLFFPLTTVIKLAVSILSVCIIRGVEMQARITFAPIPLAFGLNNGFSQQSIGYFKATAACAMQPWLMVLGIKAFGSFGSEIVEMIGGSVITEVIGLSVAYSVLSAFIGETKNMAQSIFAH